MLRLSKIFDTKRCFTFIIDHPLQIFLLMTLITLFFGWQLPKLRFQTSIYDLAIQDLPETTAYNQFKEEFGTEEIILVVMKSGNIFHPDSFQRIDRITKKLSEITGIRRVISLTNIKKEMDITDKLSLSDFEKIISPVDLLQKNLISADKKTTAISLILEDSEQKAGVIDSVAKVIDIEKKTSSLYQIGMPLVSKALATYTERDFKRLPPITFLIIALLLFFFFRNARGILIPAGSILVALIWTFGLMAYTQTALSMITMIVPIFIIAVGTAYCLHIMSEYFASIPGSASPKEAALGCFQKVRFPTTLAVLTTMIGLGSLLLNRINSIREFAIFSCFGMLSMLIIMLALLPAFLGILPLPTKTDHGRSLIKDLSDRFLTKISRLNLQHQKISLPIILVVTFLALWGTFRIKVETNPIEYFKKSTLISQHFHDIYRDMAGSFPINVVFDSKIPDYFENPSHIRQILSLQDFLSTLDGVDKTISFADYLQLVNYATNKYQEKKYALPDKPFEVRILMNSYKTMLGQDMFDRFMNEDLSKANILLRTHIASSRELLSTKKKIEAFLRENFPKDFHFQITGFGVVISQSSHLLTKGQIKSLSLTLILVSGIMLLLFLSSKVALIAMLPNCLPIIMNFGLMGWLGIKLSVATSLIASIAIGLAVDDTIHYLVRYNREFKKDSDWHRAHHDTVKSVGKPIIMTTLTISLGFSILLFSSFKPTAVFGILMVLTMLTALVGDLIILPSLMLHVRLITVWDLIKPLTTVDRLSTDIAHELIQPLNTIKIGSEFLKMMLKQGEKIPEQHLSQVAHEMSDQVDRATEIIIRLREFGKKADIAKEKVNINNPIRDFLSLFAHQLSLQNIELKLNLDETIPLISANGSGLRQVIFNLVSNAQDALNKKKKTGGGSVRDTITIRSFRENDRVAMVVSDTGIGIPAYAKRWIYEPFFTTKETGRGKGLGLFITYGIVRDYGGNIHVETREGEGTTFKLTFPFARE